MAHYSVRLNPGKGNLACDWNVVNDETGEVVSQYDYWSQATEETGRLNNER